MEKVTISWGKSSSSEPVSLKRLREDAYKSRKFEVQNLWQRSIFLVAFIVIHITGYGHLIEKLLSEYEKWLTCNETLLLVIQTISHPDYLLCPSLSRFDSLYYLDHDGEGFKSLV